MTSQKSQKKWSAEKRAEVKARQGPKMCHYCGAPAKTKDHIVPKSRALYLGTMDGYRNIVPACAECNGKKSDYRSDCECMICVTAWQLFGPPGWHKIKVIELVMEPANY